VAIRILLIMADARECEPLEGVTQVVCGWGPENARRAVEDHPHCDEIWNVGVVASLQGHSIGEVGEIGELHQVDCEPIHLGEGWRLLTRHEPLHSAEEAVELSSLYDVVDMEGYAIADAAGDTPVRLFKAVSDFGSEGASEAINQNLALCRKRLTHRLLSEL
jgi:hypothetical protein